MLTHLKVSNFAIIDNVSIDFENHLNVLTGETGAGKSLIIDAIGLLMGDRASSSLIRSGCDKATIEGTFTNYNSHINELLDEAGIDIDDYLIIRRDIFSNGKSITRINGYSVTLNQLLAITCYLADIHTQLDTKKLFDTRNYVDFIENQESKSILDIYHSYLNDYLEKLSVYKKLVKDFEDSKDNLDFYQYRLNELKSIGLKLSEEEDLENELYALNNYDNIFNSLRDILTIFKGQRIDESLYQIKQILQKLASIDDKYQDMLNVIDSISIDTSDIYDTIKDQFNHLEYDPNRLDAINMRLSVLKEVQRKYRMNIEELIDYQEKLNEMISNIDQSDFLIEEAKKKLQESFSNLVTISKKLSEVRKTNALVLTENIKNTLKDLYLDKVRININVNSTLTDKFEDNTIFKENGTDIVDILISFNAGEELRPLNKVASGGEMSRVMLALKTHLLSNVELSTIIFDEIDSGISGEVAFAVASKFKEISKNIQVLAITHLPIVAAAADQHLLVTKDVKDNKTYTKVITLSDEERIREIALMISSNKDELTSQIVAENMIKQFK